VRNLEKHCSDSLVVGAFATVVHSSNSCSFLDILLLNWFDSATSSKSYECFPGNKYMVVLELLGHSMGQLIDKVHMWKMQYKAVESNGFNSNCCICFDIALAEGIKLKSGGVQSNEQCMVKLVMPAFSSQKQWDPGGLISQTFRACKYHVLALGSLIALCILRLVFIMDNSYEPVASWHRLGGKPVFKAEGMSASLLSWAVGQAQSARCCKGLQPERLQVSRPGQCERYPVDQRRNGIQRLPPSPTSVLPQPRSSTLL
jgi:hypothetical protein